MCFERFVISLFKGPIDNFPPHTPPHSWSTPTLEGLPVCCSTCIFCRLLKWDQSEWLSHDRWQIFCNKGNKFRQGEREKRQTASWNTDGKVDSKTHPKISLRGNVLLKIVSINGHWPNVAHASLHYFITSSKLYAQPWRKNGVSDLFELNILGLRSAERQFVSTAL